jgi:DNA-binding NtrC family response regulator
MSQPARILAVDDEDDILFTIQQALQPEGYEVALAHSPAEALDSLEQAPPSLMLLDIRMGDQETAGVDLLARLRERGSDVTVIIISAMGQVDLAVKCMKLGAYDFLAKPFDITELKVTVANALRTRKLQDEVDRLRGLVEKRGLEGLRGESPAMRSVAGLIRRVAGHDITVIVTGESGTGKEVVAEAIHGESRRADKPFVSIDCTAIPEHLVESELFGFEKGAFTGAAERKLGRFELANGGTLFLDEVGNLPLPVQMKLLRVLQERRLTRLGGKASLPIDVRVVVATNADLHKLIAQGSFREDLFYRLNEFIIALPPLREREGDVELLARHFLTRFNSQFGRQVPGFSPEARQALLDHPWPGNVRELQSVVKRAVILAAEGPVLLEHLPAELTGASHPALEPAAAPPEPGLAPAAAASEEAPGEALSLKEVTARAVQRLEKEMIAQALKSCRWNKVKAAKQLKIDYKTLYNKMREYEIK